MPGNVMGKYFMEALKAKEAPCKKEDLYTFAKT